MESARFLFCENVLVTRLFTAVAKAMCALVYTHQWHKDRVAFGVVEDSDFEAFKQREALIGALCAHGHMSAYERIVATLMRWGVVEHYRGDVYRLRVDADNVGQVTACNTSERQLQFEAVATFINFEFQPGWPAGHLSHSLVDDLIQSGLLQGHRGNLSWPPDLLEYLSENVLAVPWDPDQLFDRICRSSA